MTNERFFMLRGRIYLALRRLPELEHCPLWERFMTWVKRQQREAWTAAKARMRGAAKGGRL